MMLLVDFVEGLWLLLLRVFLVDFVEGFFRFSPLAREAGEGPGERVFFCPAGDVFFAFRRVPFFVWTKKGTKKNHPAGLRHSSYPTDTSTLSRAHHPVGLIPCTLSTPQRL